MNNEEVYLNRWASLMSIFRQNGLIDRHEIDELMAASLTLSAEEFHNACMRLQAKGE